MYYSSVGGGIQTAQFTNNFNTLETSNNFSGNQRQDSLQVVDQASTTLSRFLHRTREIIDEHGDLDESKCL
jgi:hypothetical protein